MGRTGRNVPSLVGLERRLGSRIDRPRSLRWLCVASHGRSVWYYGMDQSFIATRPLPALHLSSHFDIRSPADVWQHVRGKVVAVSATLLYGNPAITPSMPYWSSFSTARRRSADALLLRVRFQVVTDSYCDQHPADMSSPADR